MTMRKQILERSQERRLVIETTTDLCAATGCPTHPRPGEWRKSRYLSEGTSIDYARVIFERYVERQDHPENYRLVEYVTETTRSVEVLEP